MTDLIVVGIILIIVGASVAYIVNAKKHGVKCIGCPAGGNCPGKSGGGCGCGCDLEEKAEE